MKPTFSGKVCLIVGGSRGIGFAIAKELYAQGASIIIAGKNKGNGRKAISEINSKSDRISFFKIDISKSREISQTVSKVINRYKKIDILVCSAGIFEPIGTFHSIPFKNHAKTIQVNLLGVMEFCHQIVPYMITNRSGKILFFSGGGIGGDTPLENASSYYVSKGALAFFAEVLAVELKKFNIQINAISPGRILTDLTKNIFELSPEILGKVLLKANRDLKKKRPTSFEGVTKLVTFLLAENPQRLSGKLLSAKWDTIPSLSKPAPSWKYTLKRIEEYVYSKK